ncbi:hypothetical protein [Thalassotalea ganghwensis]
MEQYLLIVALLIMLISSPAYLCYVDTKAKNQSSFWQVYFSDTQPRVILTFLTFPFIGLFSCTDLFICALKQKLPNWSTIFSSVLTLSWGVLLMLAVVS